jgi:hypothetical protein
MKWITRKNIKVDRVACPWLIRRFIDPAAEFLFVDEDQLLRMACLWRIDTVAVKRSDPRNVLQPRTQTPDDFIPGSCRG